MRIGTIKYLFKYEKERLSLFIVLQVYIYDVKFKVYFCYEVAHLTKLMNQNTK